MKLTKLLLFTFFSAIFASSNAAVVVTTDNSVVNSIPGLTGFTTNGAQMDGLMVTVNFSGGFTQTLAWADTGATSGGVSGDGWSLSTTGDTIDSHWLFGIEANRGQLLNFTLDASGPKQVVLFDTTFGLNLGTTGSFGGKDFVFKSCSSCDATAAYSNVVALMPDGPVGDIFHTLMVSFGDGAGPRTSFSFSQDTDNDSRLITGFVPEPGSIPLLGLGLLAMAGLARRRRS